MSPKATNNIACGETVGISQRKCADAEIVEQIVIIVARRQRAIDVCRVPSDSRWAIMFVAFGDI